MKSLSDRLMMAKSPAKAVSIGWGAFSWSPPTAWVLPRFHGRFENG
jgi:hypothetical protein